MSELPVLLVLVRSLRDDADQVEIFLGFVTKEAVEITNKSVHVSFSWKMKMLNKCPTKDSLVFHYLLFYG